MKTLRIYTAATAVGVLLSLASASQASGAPSAAQPGKTFEGSVTAVDVPDNILSVRSFLLTRDFHAGNDCRVSLQDKPVAAMSDLRRGQLVSIRYEDDHGVLIARGVAQHDLTYTGHITAIDPMKRTVLIRHGLMTRDFSIAPDCAVVMKNGNIKMPGLSNLQLGDAVYVVYEPVNGSKMAQRIEQNSATFAGTIETINPSTRLIKVRDAQAERKFTLADDCPVVINNKLTDSLGELQAGQWAYVNYNNVDGVLVANRIGLSTAPLNAPLPAPTAQASRPAQNYTYIQP